MACKACKLVHAFSCFPSHSGFPSHSVSKLSMLLSSTHCSGCIASEPILSFCATTLHNKKLLTSLAHPELEAVIGWQPLNSSTSRLLGAHHISNLQLAGSCFARTLTWHWTYLRQRRLRAQLARGSAQVKPALMRCLASTGGGRGPG